MVEVLPVMNWPKPLPPMSLRTKLRALATGGTPVRWLIVCCALLTPLDCHAYIDPNAGGWLFQLLYPLLVALGAAWLALRQRIGRWWSRLLHRRNSNKDSG